MISPGLRLGLFLGYLAFVVYGSLIPFELRDISFETAVERFANIPWLNLGAGSRADWVANILLYIPLAFMGAGLVAGPVRASAGRLLGLLFVVAFCVATAVAIEFTQQFFAPRTVSLNDLLAETLGTLIGVLLWVFGHRRIAELSRAFASGGRQSIGAAIAGYLLIYLGLAMFPFDFAVSWSELSAKLSSDRFGWLLVDDTLRRGATLSAEAAAIVPLGILIGLLARSVDFSRTLIAGMLLGLAIEFAQFFVLSSVTLGASILARTLGLMAGVFIGQLIHRHGLFPVAQWVRRFSVLILPLYLLAVAAAIGWFSHQILDFEHGLARFETIQLLPFYYHYFTSEPAAMASLLHNLALYAPLGIIVWSKHVIETGLQRRRAAEAMLVALYVAVLFEMSKLWLLGQRPDLTNVLIAMASSVLTYQLTSWIGRSSVQLQLHDERLSGNALHKQHRASSILELDRRI